MFDQGTFLFQVIEKDLLFHVMDETKVHDKVLSQLCTALSYEAGIASKPKGSVRCSTKDLVRRLSYVMNE